jgi:hypothetical protein
VRIRHEEIANLTDDYHRTALASVLGLNATLESQTNWLQRWLKQKVQREEGAINSPGSRHVRRCSIRQGGTHMIVVAALPFFWWLVFIFFWVIFLILTMNIARSKGYSPLLWGLLACILPLVTVIILLLLPSRLQA